MVNALFGIPDVAAVAREREKLKRPTSFFDPIYNRTYIYRRYYVRTTTIRFQGVTFSRVNRPAGIRLRRRPASPRKRRRAVDDRAEYIILRVVGKYNIITMTRRREPRSNRISRTVRVVTTSSRNTVFRGKNADRNTLRMAGGCPSI